MLSEPMCPDGAHGDSRRRPIWAARPSGRGHTRRRPARGTPAQYRNERAEDQLSLTVLYDADCQFCRHTCHVLRTLDRGRRLRFRPLQAFVAATADDPTPALLLDRLHAHDDRGWSAGGDAMLRIAAEIPALMPLAVFGRLSGADALVDAVYKFVADHRGPVADCFGSTAAASEAGPPVA